MYIVVMLSSYECNKIHKSFLIGTISFTVSAKNENNTSSNDFMEFIGFVCNKNVAIFMMYL